MIKQEIKNKERYDLIHSNEYQIGFEEGRQDGITDTEKILKEQYETEQKSKEEGGLVNNYNRGFIDGQNSQRLPASQDTKPCEVLHKEKDLKDDTIFINHIKSHLKEGEEVLCKICGKTAKSIIEERKQKIKGNKECIPFSIYTF